VRVKVEEIIKPDGAKEIMTKNIFEQLNSNKDYDRAKDQTMSIEEIALITKTVDKKNIITRPFTEAEVKDNIKAYADHYETSVTNTKDIATLAAA